MTKFVFAKNMLLRYLGKMLPRQKWTRQNVTGQNVTRQNVTRQIVTRQNVAEPPNHLFTFPKPYSTFQTIYLLSLNPTLLSNHLLTFPPPLLSKLSICSLKPNLLFKPFIYFPYNLLYFPSHLFTFPKPYSTFQPIYLLSLNPTLLSKPFIYFP